MSQLGFFGAMKQYFGIKPGQTAMQFGQEVKQLSAQEKEEFFRMLQAEGVNCQPPGATPTQAK